MIYNLCKTSLVLCDPYRSSFKFDYGATATIIGAGISATSATGATIAGGLGSRANRHEMRRQFNEQMDWAKENFQRQIDYSNMDWQRNREAALEDWERENAYNDPKAQMARYRAAGLNPALAMQGQNAAIANMDSPTAEGTPSSGSMPSIPQYPVDDYSGIANGVSGAVNSYFQSRIMDEQAKQLAIDNEHRVQQIVTDLDLKRSQISDYMSQIERRMNQNDTDSKQRDVMEEQIKKLQKDTEFIDDQIAYYQETWNIRKAKDEGDALASQNIAKKYGHDARMAKIESNFRASVIKAGLRLSNAQVQLIAQQIEESKVRTKKEAALAAKTILETAGLPAADTPAGKQAAKLIESQIYKNSLARTKIGSSVYGSFETEMPGYHFNTPDSDPLKYYK